MGEGDSPVSAPAGPRGIDSFFARLSAHAGKNTSSFSVFCFLVLALGIFAGYFVMARAPELIEETVMASVFLALVAYYSRNAALVLLLAGLLFVVFIA